MPADDEPRQGDARGAARGHRVLHGHAVLGDSGVRMIGLGALGYDARPAYNKSTAARCRKVGMDILLCTPERLAEAMAEIIKG